MSCPRRGWRRDIELLDVFPNSYIAWWSRQHRWIRGDWQSLTGSSLACPLATAGWNSIRFPSIHRWNIFDNLRRSLVHRRIVALLLVGWFYTPAPMLWSGIIAGLLLWPVLNAFLALLFHPPPPGTRFWRDPRDRLLRVVLTVIFLADNAAMALDAIVRVIYRRITSHRLLLEWETAARRSPTREKSGTAIHSQAGFGFPLLACSFSSARSRGEPRRW